MKRQEFNRQWQFSKCGSDQIQTIDLPHDAMILEERSAEQPSGSAGAFFAGGIYKYEKTFHVPEGWRDKEILFEFEGVLQKAVVYLNGREAGTHVYGYTPFVIHASEFLKYGEDNTISVEADNSRHPGSRWYSGSGIYKPVWLHIGEKGHIKYEGVKITTLSYQPARIKVETEHSGGQTAVEIYYDGKVIAEGSGDVAEIDIPDAKLWSDESPQLYNCRVRLWQNGQLVDEVTEAFGIRKMEWSADGLFINGKETLLRGGCVHHDNGILGARCYRESEARRVKIMKKAGYNAIRSSHYPASKALLKACDRLGMYVMDETWDMWYQKKTDHDYAKEFDQHYLHDIAAMVNRDYNHPSVIMYSIGNEVTEPAAEKGLRLTKEMTDYIHDLDSSRAVTCGLNLWLLFKASKGSSVYSDKEENTQDSNKKKSEQNMNSTVFNMVASQVGTKINNGAKSKKADEVVSPCLDILDIAGYNYSSGRYALEGKVHPQRVIVGSETYPQDIYKNWEMVKKFPYLIGDFVWTSWDYLGEVGLGAWAYTEDGGRFNKPYPWLLADCGTINILGDIGAQADYAAVVWGLHKNPVIHVQPVNHAGEKPKKMVWRGTNAMPSWSWQGCDGNKAVVEVYANAGVIKLLLNDKVIGTKKVKECKAVFRTKYMPGILTAVAYDTNRTEIGRSSLRSASGELGIQVKSEQDMVSPEEIFYVNVDIAGANGVVEANADQRLTVKVEGGELLGFGSANPRTEERYHSGSFTTYYGRAQAVIKAGKSGYIEICANGSGLPVKKERIRIAEEGR